MKANENITQVISLFELDAKQNYKEMIDETRKFAKQMELRDAVTFVFGQKT